MTFLSVKKYTLSLLLLSLPLSGYTQTEAVDDNCFFHKLSDAAIELTKHKVAYDASYFTIDYPNGDIPKGLGVNADVIIRAYRKVGIDLQKEVHEDIVGNFDKYPMAQWSQTEPDTNIDHRRVPNLQVFFSRKGIELPIDKENKTYNAGDIVIWKMNDNTPHIGIVSDKKSPFGTPLVVHNSASGQRLQNALFHFEIIGHYKYPSKYEEKSE